MAGLGARVGGAHVDVNMKFDDKSVGDIGKRVHRQLSKLGDSLKEVGDRNQEIYRSIGRDSVTAWRSLLGSIIAGAPLVGSAISAIAGGATLLAGALYSAAQSSYGFAPILVAIGIAAATAAIGMDGFIKAVKSGDLSKLTPSAQEAAMAVRSLNKAWTAVRNTVQERMFKGLADDIRELSGTLFPVLQRGLGKMATALNGLAKSLLDYANSAPGLKQIGDLLDNSADIFSRLAKAAVPFLDGLLKLLNALAPAGKRLADRIADIAVRFQEWASAPGFAQRIDEMMQRSEKTAGLLFRTLGNLGAAIVNVFNASNPATNTLLQMLVDVTQKFEDWTKSASGKNTIAEWAMNSVDVLRQFGKTAEAVFLVLAELSDPRVIISFLKTVQDAFEYLGKLPLDKLVGAFVKFAEALQPVSALFLAIIIAGAAFNILIGTVIGQLGGFVTVLRPLAGLFKPLASAGKYGKELTGLSAAFGRIGGVIAAVARPMVGLFKPLASAGKHGKEISGLVAAFARIGGAVTPILGILSKFVKFIPFVGWAVWIGVIIAKSQGLQDKLGELWAAVKDFGKSFGDAFKEIGEALKPLAPAFSGVGKAVSWVFGILDKAGEFAIGIAIEGLISVFQGLATIVRGAGKVIAGVINVIVGLFTGDLSKVTKGLGQMLNGARQMLAGLFQILLGGAAKAAKAGMDLMGKWWNGLKARFPSILAGVGRFLLSVVAFFARLPGRLLSLGARAITSLAQAIGRTTPVVIQRVTNLVTRVIQWIARLPGRLLTLGAQAVTRLAQAIARGAPNVIQRASNIFNGVINWISRLPGRLLSLGQQAVTRLANAVGAGVGRLRTVASNIFNAVIRALTNLPGRLLSIGSTAVDRISGAISNGVGRVGNAASSMGSAVINAVTGIPGQVKDIGSNIISSLVSGLSSKLDSLRSLAGKIGGIIKGALPGSPVEYGPLTAWNHGSGATGGGRNVIDAIAGGLRDTSPIKDAMNGIAGAVGGSFGPIPSIGASASPVLSNRPANGGRSRVAPRAEQPVSITQNYYGPTTSGDRLREMEWTMRYAVPGPSAVAGDTA